MDKNSALYQLMDIRVNGIMDEITRTDEEYQAIIQKADEYSGKLETLNLPNEVRELIDKYASELNANGSRYGALAYFLGFSDCIDMIFGSSHFRP